MKENKEVPSIVKTMTVLSVTNLIIFPVSVSLIPVEKIPAKFILLGWLAVNALTLNFLAKKGETLMSSMGEKGKTAINELSIAIGGNPVLSNNPLENFFKRVIQGGAKVCDDAASVLQRFVSR